MGGSETSCSSVDEESKSATSAIADVKEELSLRMQSSHMASAGAPTQEQHATCQAASVCSETAGKAPSERCTAEELRYTDSHTAEGEVKDADSCAAVEELSVVGSHTKEELNSVDSKNTRELNFAGRTAGELYCADDNRAERSSNADDSEDSGNCLVRECPQQLDRTSPREKTSASVVVDIVSEGDAGTSTTRAADSCCVQMDDESDSASEQDDLCRICHCGHEVEQLISPCLCTGSVQFVHHCCLMTWLQRAVMAKCELCLYPLAVQRKRKPFSKWRLPDEKPIPLLWLMAFVIAMTLNVSSLANDGTQRCTSKPCIVFYVLGSAGALLGMAFFYHWSKKSATYLKKWLAWNEEWRLVGPKNLPATLGHPNLAFSTKSLPTSEANQPPLPELKPTAEANQPPMAELKPTSEANQLRAPELKPTSETNQPPMPELKPTSEANQPRASELKPTSETNQPRASELKPTSEVNQPRVPELKADESSTCFPEISVVSESGSQLQVA